MTYFLWGFLISALFAVYRLGKFVALQQKEMQILKTRAKHAEDVLNLLQDVRMSQSKTEQKSDDEVREALKAFYRKEKP